MTRRIVLRLERQMQPGNRTGKVEMSRYKVNKSIRDINAKIKAGKVVVATACLLYTSDAADEVVPV